mgnify:CR=1 FL=1
MNKKKQLSVFTITATYIGTVVGAGFASGQEVLQFFGFFGYRGLAGIILATILLILFGFLILDLGRRLKAESHLPVILYAGGRWMGSIIDWVITFFLFGGLVTMAAGAGAIFTEQFGLPFIWGAAAMTASTLLTVLLGINGVISSISFVVPLLLIIVLSVAGYTIAVGHHALLANLLEYSNPAGAPVPFWPLTSLLYSSYNLVLAVAILAPLGALSSPSRLRAGAFWGGAGLGLGAAAIDLAMLTHINEASLYQIPMIFVAGTLSPGVRLVYTLILLAEVYTTAVGSLFGFVARFSSQETARYRWVAVAAGGLAFAFSQFGFSNLVGTLFPTVGLAGLLMLGSLAYNLVREKIKKPAVDFSFRSQPGRSLIFESSRELIDREKE